MCRRESNFYQESSISQNAYSTPIRKLFPENNIIVKPKYLARSARNQKCLSIFLGQYIKSVGGIFNRLFIDRYDR